MRKGIIKSIVLAAVFCVTVLVTSLLTHKTNIDLTTQMEEATLPVVRFQKGDVSINELYGYTAQMDGTKVRDAIAPLGEDLTLPLTIKTLQNEIEGISYEVRTMDMERLMEEDEISSFSQKDGEISLNLQFQNILEEGSEYVLVLTLETSGKPVYYYTRIIRETGCHVEESLDFVLNFHEQTFDKEKAGSLATYLEPNSEGDNTTLQKVTIHSSLSQVSWGDFPVKRLEAPIPSMKEISSSYNTVVLNYVVTSAGEDGQAEYYNVEEYYRVRYSGTNNRMSLLNFERTMSEIFRGENGQIKPDSIFLGIRDQNVEYKANERGNVIAFVQEGELWSYNSDSSQISRVYSFRSTEGIDERENNTQHQIKIIKIDETGSMDFVVYGYMNRGNHEGMTGIAVVHYDSVGNTTEEELFIPSDKSYEVLKAEWGKIFYVSDGNIFYFLADEALYSVNLYSREAKELMTGLEEGRYVVSEEGRFIAWQDSDSRYDADALKIMDLEGEEVRKIKAEKEECLLPVGFVQSDFVYGAAKKSDIVNDSAGNVRFPMYRIQIVDEKSQVIKDYQKDGYYVTKAYVQNETIYLNREFFNGTAFVPAEQDTVKNQQLESSRVISLETVQSEPKQRQVRLVLGKEGENTESNPQLLSPKEIVVKEKRTVTLDTQREQEIYYVYSGGKILLATPFVSEAISAADSSMGVVTGDAQQYIWRRGRSTFQPVVGNVVIDPAQAGEDSVSRCLTALLQTEGISMDVAGLLAQGETPRQIMTEALTDRKVIDLTGCSTDQVLYYVGKKTPVFAMVNNEAFLIVGYDEHNVILYNPQTNATVKKGQQDSDTMFREAGNIFLGYIE